MLQRIFSCLMLLALGAALSGQLGGVMASDSSPAAQAADPAGQAAGAAGQPPLPSPASMTYRLPQDLKFPDKTEGNAQIVLFGDPSKPGSPYEVLQKWYPHSMSRPHFHENDRYIYVVSGTWWVGSGPNYDPNSTYPMVAGSFIHHIARGIHYDGAKDEPCVLIISGVGPAQPFPLTYRKLSNAELDKLKISEAQPDKVQSAPNK